MVRSFLMDVPSLGETLLRDETSLSELLAASRRGNLWWSLWGGIKQLVISIPTWGVMGFSDSNPAPDGFSLSKMLGSTGCWRRHIFDLLYLPGSHHTLVAPGEIIWWMEYLGTNIEPLLKDLHKAFHFASHIKSLPPRISLHRNFF